MESKFTIQILAATRQKLSRDLVSINFGCRYLPLHVTPLMSSRVLVTDWMILRSGLEVECRAKLSASRRKTTNARSAIHMTVFMTHFL
jgi:hypothetical protein